MRCMRRIRVIHLWRPHGGDVWVVEKNWQALYFFFFKKKKALYLFNDYLKNKIPN